MAKSRNNHNRDHSFDDDNEIEDSERDRSSMRKKSKTPKFHRYSSNVIFDEDDDCFS